MNNENAYPVVKVFWGLLLCPAVGSGIVGILMASMLVAEKGLLSEGNLLAHAVSALAIPLLIIILGELLFLVPALLLSLFCVSRRFFREWKSYAYVASFGAFGALLWMEFLARYFFQPDYVASTFKVVEGGAVVLVLGSVSTLCMGFLVFPSRRCSGAQ